VAAALEGRRVGVRRRVALWRALHPAMRAGRRGRAAVAHHYDLPSAFYALFLDPLMVYTCGYYRYPEADLAEAQRDKLDLVCRKLRLVPGELLLDLGCGWGGLAIWAARHYGVRVHAVTLSAAQAAYARAWVARERLERLIRVEERDCLDPTLAGPYDKVAGIGVTEHLACPRTPATSRPYIASCVPAGSSSTTASRSRPPGATARSGTS